ncbi:MULTISPECIES: TonB-dependent siderophore receptor [unclassified Haematobacter]|uniref:TonB-dependent siderophore receptor n=1 Tax=unclassified Haematobacter TaxID=2640585 RepID=UPI0025C66EFD|nr:MULTISPECIES: TonB-dependent siderophore receptor [unclassified Haematobacter]
MASNRQDGHRGWQIAALCGATALLPAAAMAQEAAAVAAQGAVGLSPVVIDSQAGGDAVTFAPRLQVSANKMASDALDTSASVSVVTQKEIESRGAQTLEQVVSYTAGVLVNEWGSDDRYDYIRIRGFDQNTLLTFRDGLPTRGFGWTFGRLEPYGLERVEVLKGSNSALFGLSSPGGVINSVTKMPRPYRFGEVYTTLGDDHTEAGFDFGDATADRTLSYRLTGKAQEAEGYYDHSPDDRRYLGAALTWAPTEATSLTLLGDYNRRDGWPGTGFPKGTANRLGYRTFLGEPEFNTFDTRQKSLGYLLSHDFGGGLTFRQNARYSWLDLDYRQVYGASTDPTADRTSFFVGSKARQFAIDNQLQFDTSFGNVRGRTLAGYEYSWIRVDELAQVGTAGPLDIFDIAHCGRGCVTLGPYIDWRPEQTTHALYLQQELTFDDRWILTLGGRYDRTDVDIDYGAADYRGPGRADRDFNAFTKRAGLTYRATPDLSFYANYSESFEPDPWAPASDPKEGKQYEAGVKYRPPGTEALLTAAVFDLTQTNVSVQVDPVNYRQIGKIGVRGLELEAKGEVMDNLNLTFAYAYWDAEIREDGVQGNLGNRPARVPRHIGAIWADYTFPGTAARGDLRIGGGMRYMDATYGDDANTVRVGGYAVFDAMASYRLTEDVLLQANVSNLFDRHYLVTDYYGTEYFSDGRTVTATLKYTW